MKRRILSLTAMAAMALFCSSCKREPPLHLYDSATADFQLPVIDLQLDVYWDYEMVYGIHYDWRDEWYYGWDEDDRATFGELGYTEPTEFNLRRYYTADTPYGRHQRVYKDRVYGKTFSGRYEWGYWDLLVWNEISTLDGVQSIRIDEPADMTDITASTGPSMQASRYQAPRHTRSYYEPELLFTAYNQAEYLDPDLKDFTYDPERNVYYKQLKMQLEPVTYIYLTQVILHNNRGRVTSVDGSANLSGMARSVNLNSGIAGEDPITVYYNVRFKRDCKKQSELVDIAGGRLITFGLCGNNPNRITKAQEVTDKEPHYMDVTMQFNNGMDSTLVFNVTDQVRKRYRGGVITVELDMDTVPIPTRRGGSGFDAVILPPEEETHEFEM